jgi:hypothetical protein
LTYTAGMALPYHRTFLLVALLSFLALEIAAEVTANDKESPIVLVSTIFAVTRQVILCTNEISTTGTIAIRYPKMSVDTLDPLLV